MKGAPLPQVQQLAGERLHVGNRQCKGKRQTIFMEGAKKKRTHLLFFSLRLYLRSFDFFFGTSLPPAYFFLFERGFFIYSKFCPTNPGAYRRRRSNLEFLVVSCP